MADSLRRLVAWRKSRGSNFAKVWSDLYDAGDPEAKDLNRARRLVSRYFDDIGRLYDVGLISGKLARGLTATYGIQVFYEICEPMNNARNPTRLQVYSNHVRYLRHTYGKNRLDS